VNPRENLKAYLDGELSAGQRAEVERAIASDPSLASELDALRRLTWTLRTSPQPTPYGMEDTLVALQRGRSAVPRIRLLGLLAGVASTVLVVALTLPLFWQPTRTESADSVAMVAMERSEGFAGDAPSSSSVEEFSPSPPPAEEALASQPAPADRPSVRSGPRSGSVPRRQSTDAPPPVAQDVAPPEEAAPLAVNSDEQREVVLSVSSIELADSALRRLAREHQVLVAAVAATESDRTITLDIPEDKVEEFLKLVQLLPEQLGQERAVVERSSADVIGAPPPVPTVSGGAQAKEQAPEGKKRSVTIVLKPQKRDEPVP
jgi:hypothetical protein